jgi:hypothetical protein
MLFESCENQITTPNTPNTVGAELLWENPSILTISHPFEQFINGMDEYYNSIFGVIIAAVASRNCSHNIYENLSSLFLGWFRWALKAFL